MKKELKNILKYLVVYGILLVTPAVLLAFVEVVADRMRGGTMNSDEVWNSPLHDLGVTFGLLAHHRRVFVAAMGNNRFGAHTPCRRVAGRA